MPSKQSVPSRLYPIDHHSLQDFDALCSQSTRHSDYPNAVSVESNIPVYDASTICPSGCAPDPATASVLQDEWYHILLSGPGVFVLRNLYPRPLLAAVNGVFASLIDSENAASSASSSSSSSSSKGDHFSAGANTRLWNSFGKHALASPATFVPYYASPLLSLVCAAWLGPAYRVTAQLNVVHPGGAAQVSHRDYHLGFQPSAAACRYPRAAHAATQLLTLQGAVAHTDMPPASGPTRFLPFSQSFAGGYLACRLPAFDDYFLARHVSLPLAAGDAVFFNPGLHHAAGANASARDRSANLLQVSSPFGRPMESLDSVPIVTACWAGLRDLFDREGMGERVEAGVRAVGEGYAFPTNLDRRGPRGEGLAPESEQDVLRRALREGWGVEEVVAALETMREDSRA